MVDRSYKCKGFHCLTVYNHQRLAMQTATVRLQMPLIVIVARSLEFFENNITEVLEVVQALL